MAVCRAQTLRLDRRSRHDPQQGHPWDSSVSVDALGGVATGSRKVTQHGHDPTGHMLQKHRGITGRTLQRGGYNA